MQSARQGTASHESDNGEEYVVDLMSSNMISVCIVFSFFPLPFHPTRETRRMRRLGPGEVKYLMPS